MCTFQNCYKTYAWSFCYNESKDGTTKVFKMFLGDVVYKGERDEEHDVIVRGIQYRSNDDEFNETVTNYRGDVMYSNMISKLCAYNPRSEFILQVLRDMLVENENQQIMILAHNKALLKYLFDAIDERKIASVGLLYWRNERSSIERK